MNAARLRAAAVDAATLRATVAADPLLARRVLVVKAFQAQRLARSHADLLADPRYAQAARFFLDDLYGTKDFTRRDAELSRVIPALTRFLPESALLTVADAVELDALSESLDVGLARRLAAGAEAGALTPQAYASAYAQPADRPARERQLALVLEIGGALDKLVRNRLVGGLLSAMRGPARAAGLEEMHEFLHRGFQAFRAMNGASRFLERVDARERALMEQLFGTGRFDG